MWINVESTSRDIGVDVNLDSSGGDDDGNICGSSVVSPPRIIAPTLIKGLDCFGWHESFRLVVDLSMSCEEGRRIGIVFVVVVFEYSWW